MVELERLQCQWKDQVGDSERGQHFEEDKMDLLGAGIASGNK